MNKPAAVLGVFLAIAAAAAIGWGSFKFVDRQAAGLREARVTTRVETTKAAAAALDNWFKGARAQAAALAAALQPWPASRPLATDARSRLDRKTPGGGSARGGDRLGFVGTAG